MTTQDNQDGRDEFNDPDPILCPRCNSANWRCYDERSYACFDRGGNFCGDKVTGFLVCKDCDLAYTHDAVDPHDDGCVDCEGD